MSIVKMEHDRPSQKDLANRSPDTLIRYIRILQLRIAAEEAAKKVTSDYAGDCSLLKLQAD